MNNLKLLYMGTNAFAVEPLRALCKSGIFKKVTAVTQPDKPCGRNNKLKSPEVKVFAISEQLECLQPESLKEEVFGDELKRIDPDFIIVASYGKLLPEYLLEFPKFGSVNIHASLLPEYRGAAPVNRVIMDGRNETGITIMYMAKGLDTGDIIESKKLLIGENECFGELYERLSSLGAEMIVSSVKDIITGQSKRIAQDDSKSTYASKLTKEDEPIDWSLSSIEINNRIRGLSPEPCACTLHKESNRNLKIYTASVTEDDQFHSNYGEIINTSKKIEVACGRGTLLLSSMQFQGEKRLADKDFLNGRKISLGDKLL